MRAEPRANEGLLCSACQSFMVRGPCSPAAPALGAEFESFRCHADTPSSGYTDPNCTCLPTCPCKSFSPCAQSCCYRIPSGLYHVPDDVLRQLQGLPPTSSTGTAMQMSTIGGVSNPGPSYVYEDSVKKGCCCVVM